MFRIEQNGRMSLGRPKPKEVQRLMKKKIIKIVKIIKADATCFGSRRTIIREPHPVLSQNYISGINVHVVIDVVSVVAAYCHHNTDNINIGTLVPDM